MSSSKWFNVFWRYVRSGSYQQFVRDLEKKRDLTEIMNINLEIRTVYVEEINNNPKFKDLGLIRLDSDDSTILAENCDRIKHIIPTFERIMVGNHGVYVEFTEPGDKGEYIQTNKDYVWYEKNLMKFYKQTKTVNYADYKIGRWYVSIYDVFDIEHPKR